MAQEYDILARFKFLEQPGVARMSKAGRAIQAFSRKAKMVGAGVRQIGSGVRTLGLLSLGATVLVGGVVKKTMDFNKQMSAVQSKTRSSAAEFQELRASALKMGASTTFTATQSAEALEMIATAGFDAKQSMAMLSPTLHLAEASSIDLASSSRIVTDQIRTFNLRAKDAGMVADVLAYTSAKSSTTVLSLGESLKFAGVTAARTGQDIKATAAMLGLLGNIGLRGSLAGTAVKNAFVKLTKQGPALREMFGGKKGVKQLLTDSTGKFRGIDRVMFDVIVRLGKINNQADRTKMAFEIFGIRGKAAMDAFAVAGERAGKMKAFLDGIRNKSVGAAKEMAKIRIDNLAGDFTIFKSAVEGAQIAIGGMLVKSFNLRTGVQSLSGFVQKMALAFEDMNKGLSETGIIDKYGSTVAAVVFGIKAAVSGVKQAFIDVWKTLSGVFSTFTKGGASSVKTVVTLITKVLLFGAVLGPIALAIGAIGMAAGAAFNIVGGGIKIVTALMSPWGMAIMAVILLLSTFKKKGESTFGFLKRMVSGVAKAFSPIIAALKFMVKHVGVLGTMLVGGGAIMGGRALLARRAGAGAAGAGGTAGLAGLAGGGTPVRVTNWAEARMFLGGGVGGVPGAAGAPVVAGKMSGLMKVAIAAPIIGAIISTTEARRKEISARVKLYDKPLLAHTWKVATGIAAMANQLSAKMEKRGAFILGAKKEFFKETERGVLATKSIQAILAKGATRDISGKMSISTDDLASSSADLRKVQAELTKQKQVIASGLAAAGLTQKEIAKDPRFEAMTGILQAIDRRFAMQAQGKMTADIRIVLPDGSVIAKQNAQLVTQNKERAGISPSPGQRRRNVERGY